MAVLEDLSEEERYEAWSIYYEYTTKESPLEYVEYCTFMETGTPPEGTEITYA